MEPEEEKEEKEEEEEFFLLALCQKPLTMMNNF